MKERYLSKTPNVTFVYLSKCNIKLPCFFGNSKKRFLWTGLVGTFPIGLRCILNTFEFYPLPDHTVAFNFIRSKQYHWARCYHRFPRICAAHCFRGLWNHFAGLCARHVAFSRKSGLWNARSGYPRWTAPPLILNAIPVHGQWEAMRRWSEGHG